jgi:colicin import membrane protein
MNTIRKTTGTRNYGFGSGGYSPRHLGVYLGISAVAHALFFLASIWLVQFEVPGAFSSVVQVDLVSFAPGEPGGLTPGAIQEPADRNDLPPEPPDKALEPLADTDVVVPDTKPLPEAKTPEPVATLKPDVSLKTKPKNLQELMAAQDKKQPEEKKDPPAPKPDPQKEREKARQARAEQEAAQKKEALAQAEQEAARKREQLTQAMERLARAVETQDRESSARSTGQAPGSGTGGGGKAGTPLDLYKMVLQSAIQQNWVFNELLAGMDQNLEVRILIKILKNGEIRDIIYDTRSGNRYLDQSARRAIERASPLPPLPKGMASYDVVVIFTPKGLR